MDIWDEIEKIKGYLSELKKSRKNWLGIDVETVLAGNIEFFKNL